jgi:hypothetical protein
VDPPSRIPRNLAPVKVPGYNGEGVGVGVGVRSQPGKDSRSPTRSGVLAVVGAHRPWRRAYAADQPSSAAGVHLPAALTDPEASAAQALAVRPSRLSADDTEQPVRRDGAGRGDLKDHDVTTPTMEVTNVLAGQLDARPTPPTPLPWR